MKPTSISSKISIALCMLFLANNIATAQMPTATVQAGTHPSGLMPSAMEMEPANYKKFLYPYRDSDTEILTLNRGFEKHPELGMLYYGAPSENCFEDLAKRTEKTKTFIKKGTNGSGLYVQSSTEPMHYKDANGDWITINSFLLPSNVTGVYSALHQTDPVIINTNESGYVKIGKDGKSISINQSLELIYLSNDGTQQSLGKADWTRHTAGKDGVYVTDAWPGIDIEIQAKLGGTETNFVIKYAFPQYANGKLLVRDHLKMDSGLSLFAYGKEVYRGRLEIRNEKGEKEFNIGKACAFEKNAVKETYSNLDYKIDGNVLDIVVPGSFLNRPSGSYPVIVDPFVQSVNSVPSQGSTYSNNWTLFCTTNNSVPVPSGMTISNVAFTFSYTANGTNLAEPWLWNGRYNFLYNACQSPAGVGGFWSCWTANFPGTCQGVNQTIWNHVSTCALPAQCSYNQNVSMRFYRNVNPGVCDNSGIVASTPYTITIEGNTLTMGTVNASLGTVTPICGGTSVNLSANATFGVPTLTYTWMPGNLSGQNVTVNPTTTTTYTVTVSDACGNLVNGTVTVNVLPAPPPPTVTTPINLCQGSPAPNMSTYVTGTGVLWYTQAVGGVGSGSAPVISTAGVQTYNYWVSQTVNGCESARVPIVVNVSATPPPPTVTSPVILCQNSSPPAITTYVTSGVGLLWYLTPIGGVGNPTAPNITTSNVSTITHYVSQTINGCESQRVGILISVTAQPPMPSSPSPINYCQFATATPLTAVGLGIKWYDVPTGGVALPTAPTPNTAIVGTVTYYVTQTINGCESQRRPVVVNIIATPPPPTVVSPLTFCQGQPATPLGNNVTGTAIKWYAAQTGGVPITPVPTVNTNVISTTSYWVSQTVNGCESERTELIVIVATQPGAPTVISPVIFCQGEPATPLSPNVTGTGLLWYTQAVGGVGSATEPIINTANTGSTTYWVSQSVGTCEGPRTPIVVTINPKPAAPTVTSPITICQFSISIQLTATGQNLLWYPGPVGGVGNALAPTPNTAITGPQDYYVSQTVNGCESNRAHIIVNVNPTPAAPVVVGSPITYCQFETAAPITNNVTGTALKWYTQAVGGVGATTAPVINTNVTSNTTYYISQTVGGCESERTPLQVIIGTSPLPPVIVTPLEYCQDAVMAPLANSVTGFNLMWYTVGVGGVGSATPPTIDPAIPGTTFLYITQGLGNCESQRDTLEVIIHPTPAAPIANDIEVCQFDIVQLTAQGQNLLWYPTATGGTGASTVTANTQTPGGPTYYYVSQTINNCEGPRRQVGVTVKPQPIVPVTQTSYTYCQFDVATQLAATGTLLQWYDVPVGGSPLPAAPTPNTTIAGTFHYYVTQTENGCESERVDITVLVHPKPGLPTVEHVSICQGDATPILNAVGQNLLWYTAATGGTGSPDMPTPQTADTGVTEYFVSQTINGCEGDRAVIRVTVNPKVEASLTASTQNGCTGQLITITFSGNGPSTSTYDWSFDGADDVSGTGAGPYDVIWETVGDKTVTVTISNMGCTATASMIVNIQSTPEAHFDIKKDVCLNEEIRVQTDYDLMNLPEYTWNFGYATVLDGSGYGPYTLKWNTIGQKIVSLQLTGINCPSEIYYDTINVHHPLAKIMNLSSNDICTADSVLFNAQPGLDYQYQWLPVSYFGENINSMSAWGIVQKAGFVWLKVTDRWGCEATDSLILEPKNCCDVFLPNVFTPNNDGKNDIFKIVTKGNQELSTFIIMDRWGKRVFETVNQFEGWDGSFNGEAQDIGNYSYYLRYRCADTKEIMEMKGDVILLR